jgi:hypothetical protein
MFRMKHFFALSFLFFLVLLLDVKVHAQIGGNGVYTFLNMPTNARSSALGGQVISVKDDDINFVGDNPSLLDTNMIEKASFSYVNYVSDIGAGNVAYVSKIKGIGPVMFGLQYLSYGKFIETDELGNEIGQFKSGDFCLHASHARPINENFSYGGSFKIIYSNFYELNSVGVAIDAGASYLSDNKSFSAGFVIRNVGVQLKPYLEGERDNLPILVQFGISKKVAKAPFRLSLMVNNMQRWDLTYDDPFNPKPIDPVSGEVKDPIITLDKIARHLVYGIEFLPSESFHLRFGYNHLRRKEMAVFPRNGLTAFSMGVGIKMSKFTIDYGLNSYFPGRFSNVFTLSTNFAALTKKRSN